LTIRRPQNVSVIFGDQAMLLLDNLNSQGAGDQFHGIFIEGPGSGVTLKNPNVRWMRKPAKRSEGDGIRLHGYPSEDGALRNIRIGSSSVLDAPQAGLILIGCSDVNIDVHTSRGTLADGFHVNASRRVNVGQIYGTDTGDDACAFVNYYSNHMGGIYGRDDIDPFSEPNYAEFCNNDCIVQQVHAVGGRASGVRLAQSKNVTIEYVEASEKHQAVIADGGRQGGQFAWSNLQPVNCNIGTIVARDCEIGFIARSYDDSPSGPGRDSDPRFFTMGLRIIHLVAEKCVKSLVVHDIQGLRIDQANITGGGIFVSNTKNCEFGKFVIVHATQSEITAASRGQFAEIQTHDANIAIRN
jgi:hypothetical protein